MQVEKRYNVEMVLRENDNKMVANNFANGEKHKAVWFAAR